MTKSIKPLNIRMKMIPRNFMILDLVVSLLFWRFAMLARITRKIPIGPSSSKPSKKSCEFKMLDISKPFSLVKHPPNMPRLPFYA
ncbi:MAG: hypothetical protein ACJA2X_000772 [Halocynthiibacter sp.]|jgi:hypothetical protein